MFKIKLLSPGKVKEPWLEAALAEYIKRLKPYVQWDMRWVKTDAELVKEAEGTPFLVCLDPNGTLMTSEVFSHFLMKSFEDNKGNITFVIGGPEGLPSALKRYPLISLSLMTLTHQMCRLILVEQIYRALEIARGSSYHK